MFTEGLTPSFVGPKVDDDEFIRSGGDLSKAIGNGGLNNPSIERSVDPSLLSVKSGALEDLRAQGCLVASSSTEGLGLCNQERSSS